MFKSCDFTALSLVRTLISPPKEPFLLIQHCAGININNKYTIVAITSKNKSQSSRKVTKYYLTIYSFQMNCWHQEMWPDHLDLIFDSGSVCIHGRKQRSKCHRRANASGNVFLFGCALTRIRVPSCLWMCARARVFVNASAMLAEWHETSHRPCYF